MLLLLLLGLLADGFEVPELFFTAISSCFVVPVDLLLLLLLLVLIVVVVVVLVLADSEVLDPAVVVAAARAAFLLSSCSTSAAQSVIGAGLTRDWFFTLIVELPELPSPWIFSVFVECCDRDGWVDLDSP